MGDSDDENYDRRRSGARDKFRRERNDYERQDDRRGGGGGGRDQWEDRGREGWNSRNRDGGDRRGGNMYNRDYDNNRRRERYSPQSQRHDMSPPQKRMRRDWDEAGGGSSYGQQHHEYGSGYNAQHGNQQHHGGGGWGHSGPAGGDMPPPQQHHYGGGPRGHDSGFQTQPPLMAFKAFLAQQDDNITDEESIKKFNEYKVEFKKIQINEFFLAHKEEEWFRSKYHPEECGKRRLDQRTALKKRATVFMEQFDRGKIEALSCDLEKSEELIKLLDTAVIKMEGGTDFDLQILESGDWPAPQQDIARSRTTSETTPKKAEPEKTETPSEDNKEDTGEIEDNDDDAEEGEEKKSEKEKGEEGENEDKEKEQKETVKEGKDGGEEEELKKQAEEFKKEKEKAESESEKKKKKRNKGEYDDESDSGSDSDSSSESDSEPAPPGAGDEQAGSEAASGNKKSKKEEKKDLEKEIDTKEEKPDDDPCPRALHRTTSIFLRNLAPSITKQEVEAMCKRYPGFMRVALQDPQPERQFFRRGWVTFDHTVNIKDICWNLNNIRLRECEMGAIVNRELKQRVRPINGIASHKQVVRADIKHAAKIIQNLDDKWNLWEENDQEKKDREKESFGLVSKNPVLKNITDYLVEEGSYEEEELLGTAVDDKPKEANPEFTIERDEELIKVLDRMILYLRIVHSYDFYSAVEYPNEDEMPHRCGIIHARGPVPPNRVTQHDLNEWLRHFEQKVSPALDSHAALEEHEASKLGHKDIEVELEKFVTANTQELAKDKWLCPLSGKKFKGPEFVRKHIFNKHAEKVEEVKQEVAFFNNYLMDAKRPQLQEHPGNRGPPTPQRQDSFGSGHGGAGGGGGGYHQGPQQQQMMGGYNSHRGGGGHQFHGSHHTPYNYQSRGHEPNYRQDNRRRDSFPPRNRERGRPDPRGIIEYRDLDAPDDVDIF